MHCYTEGKGGELSSAVTTLESLKQKAIEKTVGVGINEELCRGSVNVRTRLNHFLLSPKTVDLSYSILEKLCTVYEFSYIFSLETKEVSDIIKLNLTPFLTLPHP